MCCLTDTQLGKRAILDGRASAVWVVGWFCYEPYHGGLKIGLITRGIYVP